ncbi:hypothetical protein PF003_g20032 [Phytophthora fragariae]|nr:hypothetical protein PF003_g20032 [Phytophthora fragariae]
MASHGSGGDSDSYSDGPEESGYRDAFVSEVFIVDANPGEGGRSTPATATTTPGAPTEGTARGERGADAPPGDASQPDLTTPEGRGAVRDVLAGLWPAPATPAEDKAKVLTGTAVTRQLRVQVIKEEPRLISKACPYPSHKVVKGPDFKHKGRGVQVKTEQPQPLGQSSLASVQEHGQPTQGGQGQQGLGGYGPQLSDPYPGQPYGLSSQSTQQANPFATGATSTPTPTTQYNAPYGGTAYGVTTSAAPSVKMPQTAIASYGGISVANMQRAGFGFANPFSQLAGQAPPILPAPQQPQQPVWTGQTQPSPQPQAWQGQMGANVNSPSSAKVEPPQSSRSSLAGQQSYGGVPGYGSNGNPYVNSNEKQPVFGMPSSIKNAQQNAGSGNGYSPRNSRACYMCKAMDHGVSDCPLMSMLRSMAGQNATGTTPVEGDGTGGGFSNTTYGVVVEFEGVLRDDGADNYAPNMYETTDLEVNTNGLEDEDYDDKRSAWGRDEYDYNETAPVSVVNPKFGGVLPTDDVGNWERSSIPGAVATDATSSANTGSAEDEGKRTDRSAERPPKALEEQGEGHTAPVVKEEVVRNESVAFDDDWDWEDCFRDEYVGSLGYGINPVKEKECDEVSTLPVEATSDGEDKMNGTTVEVGDTTCAGTPPGRDGENLVERSELAGEGKHSDDEDPADGALGTLSGDVEMVRAEVVAGVTDASPTAKPQVEEDRSKGAVRNAPPLNRLFTSEELDLLMEASYGKLSTRWSKLNGSWKPLDAQLAKFSWKPVDLHVAG